ATRTAKFGPGAPARNANLLNGLPPAAFLPVGGKAADADKLDGIDSTGFLGVNAKAADANLLDGTDSTSLVLHCPAGTTRGFDICFDNAVQAGTNAFSA